MSMSTNGNFAESGYFFSDPALYPKNASKTEPDQFLDPGSFLGGFFISGSEIAT